MYQDLAQARRECHVTLAKWNRDTRRLSDLLAQFESYTPEAFIVSVHEILPEFYRQSRAFAARIQILVQMLQSGIPRPKDDSSEPAGSNPS